MYRTCFIVLVLISTLLLTSCSQTETAPTLAPDSPMETETWGVIVLGDIDADDPISKIEEFQPIGDALANGLSDFGIGSAAVRIAPDIDSMITMMASGEIDVYYDSLYPAMVVADATGARPLIRGWRGGEPTYRSLFFALSDSGITSLQDLNGKIIALEDISSTSGYMMPVSHLISQGLDPVEKVSTDSNVAEDEVGYVFSADDDNTIEWVLSGLVDVGVVDNLTYVNDIPEETRNRLVIVAETIDVPRRVLMVGPDVAPEVATAIAEILMGLDETEQGRELLEILSTAQFDEFPGGVEAIFGPIQAMFDVITNEG